MGSQSLLQGIFLSQGSNLGLLHGQADSLPSEPQWLRHIYYSKYFIVFTKHSQQIWLGLTRSILHCRKLYCMEVNWFAQSHSAGVSSELKPVCVTALLAFQFHTTCPKYCFKIRALQTDFVSFLQWESREVQWGLRVRFPWCVLPTFCKHWMNIFFLRTKQYSCLSTEIGHQQEAGPARRCWGSKVDRPGTGSTFINTT